MELVKNWREIALKSYAMWAVYLGAFCMLLPELFFWYSGFELLGPRVWWLVGLVLLVGGGLGRLVKQRTIDPSRVRSPGVISLALILGVAMSSFSSAVPDDPRVPVSTVGVASDAAFLMTVVPFVGRWEGLRLAAYLDIVGVPTVCYGETKGVMLGDVYTKSQCDAMFGRELINYRRGLHAFFEADTLADHLPVPRDVAFTSLAYNVGVTGAGKSTAVRRLNAGDLYGACQALTWWNKAGGRVIRGLVNRRSDERDLCLQGLA